MLLEDEDVYLAQESISSDDEVSHNVNADVYIVPLNEAAIE